MVIFLIYYLIIFICIFHLSLVSVKVILQHNQKINFPDWVSILVHF